MAMATVHAPDAKPAERAPARWQDYVQLLKPRVMSLVVFTGLTGLVCAGKPVNPIIAAVAILCIAVGAGASASLTRKPGATSPEQAHRSNSACIVPWIAMKLGRKLKWDPKAEQFIGDDAANAMLSRPERTPFGATRFVAGLKA